jgi:predicted RNase H-like HicB family nuclease
MKKSKKEFVEKYVGMPHAIQVKEDSGGFVVTIPDLPGCISQGDSVEEAYEMIMDAKRGWIEVALDEGHPIPEPSEEKKGKWKKVKKKELLTGHTMTEKGGSYTRPDSPPEMVYRYKTPKSKKKKDNRGITYEVGEWKLKNDNWKYCPHCGKELK